MPTFCRCFIDLQKVHDSEDTKLATVGSRIIRQMAAPNRVALSALAGVPVGGKSSVCLICMKYRIIILIIIIKRPGEILLSYIANTSHSRTHPVLMDPSQHFIIDEIHLLSLTIFAQEALVTRNV